jgi:4-diphosphocytidyl-2-C-methyl-D-erythritol kinase
MYIFNDGTEWVVHAPAKLNLFFEILGRRADGYHEVETLICPIRVFDTLLFREIPGGDIHFSCEWAAAPRAEMIAADAARRKVPQGRDNLAYRALELLRQRAGVDRGATVRLIKRIPVEAGLGGGSSDAAAALLVANRAWDLHWPNAALAPLAAELGSDVPFFLADGPAICRGRGEQVSPVRGLGCWQFVVVYPSTGLATAAVYAACRPNPKPATVEPLVAALRRGEISRAGTLLGNRLQPAAETLAPVLAQIRREFARLDLPGHAMTGSGSAYFGLCHHADHARHAAARLRARGLGQVFAVSSCR